MVVAVFDCAFEHIDEGLKSALRMVIEDSGAGPVFCHQEKRIACRPISTADEVTLQMRGRTAALDRRALDTQYGAFGRVVAGFRTHRVLEFASGRIWAGEGERPVRPDEGRHCCRPKTVQLATADADRRP